MVVGGNTPMIEMRHVAKAFGNNLVLRDFNFRLAKGQSLVVLGGSGSGKSVCLKCLLGLIEPDAGDVLINGTRLNGLSQKQRQLQIGNIGMLFQNAALFDSFPVWRNIAFGLIEGQGMETNNARRIALEKLEMVGLGEKIANLLPAELSGGMRKRVGLARAIATDPKILFFDEPTTGLDPIMGQVIDRLIVSCVKELGATAVTITHDMASLHRIADQVVMLFEGQDIWHGAVGDIDTTTNPHVRQFISGSAEGPIRMPVHKNALHKTNHAERNHHA